MKPHFHLTPEILHAVSRIERLIGRIEGLEQPKPQPHLRKSNRVRTIQGSLAIEGNTLDLDQVTALLEGQIKRDTNYQNPANILANPRFSNRRVSAQRMGVVWFWRSVVRERR